MTENALVVLEEEIKALAAEMGATTDDLQGGGNFLPSLKVWMDEDSEEEGAPRLKGKMFLTGTDPVLFAKPGTVVFRPLTQMFQWTEWDKDAKKTVNRSRLIYNFKEEARDEKGTLKCGKPPSKDLRDNPALAKQYENITTWRRLQGLVSFVGIDKDGNEVAVNNKLIGLNLKGANFVPFDEEYIQLMPKGSMLWDFEAKISTTREKNGSVTYYIMHFEPDFVDRKKFTPEVYETLKALKADAEATNKEIDQKYYDALNRRKSDADVVDSLKTVGASASGRPGMNRGLSADLDIPF
jgi:hypothetical protein